MQERPQAEEQTILVARAEGRATINQAGRDINIGHEAQDHRRVAGTVGLPTPPPVPPRPSGPAQGQGWSVAGQVQNASRSAAHDVRVSLLDQEDREVPVPSLCRPHLGAGAQWDFSWSVGWLFAPPPHPLPSGAQPPMALPAPEAITNQGARPRLKIMFTDAASEMWERVGHRIEPVASAADPLLPSQEAYNRAVERLTGASHDLGTSDAEEIINDLLRSVLHAVNERMGPTLGVQPSIGDAVNTLLNRSGEWRIAPGYDDRSPAALATLAGALTQLDGYVMRVARTAIDMRQGDHAEYLRPFCAQACATLTVLGGLLPVT